MAIREREQRPHHKRQPTLADYEFKLFPIESGFVAHHPPAASALNDGASLRIVHRLASVRSRTLKGIRRKAREVN